MKLPIYSVKSEHTGMWFSPTPAPFVEFMKVFDEFCKQYPDIKFTLYHCGYFNTLNGKFTILKTPKLVNPNEKR